MQRGGAGAAQSWRDASQNKLWRSWCTRDGQLGRGAPARSAHKSQEPIGAIAQDSSARAGEPSRRAVARDPSQVPSVRVRGRWAAGGQFWACRRQFWAATQ